MDEREAIEWLKRGEIGGLEALVRYHQLDAVRAAHLVTHDLALAQDVVQSAFLKVYERIGQFDPSRPFGPWFYTAVLRDAIKAANRRARASPLESLRHLMEPRDPSDGPEQALEQRRPPPRSLLRSCSSRPSSGPPSWRAISSDSVNTR